MTLDELIKSLNDLKTYYRVEQGEDIGNRPVEIQTYTDKGQIGYSEGDISVCFNQHPYDVDIEEYNVIIYSDNYSEED